MNTMERARKAISAYMLVESRILHLTLECDAIATTALRNNLSVDWYTIPQYLMLLRYEAVCGRVARRYHEAMGVSEL